jgi:hypothetical protein
VVEGIFIAAGNSKTYRKELNIVNKLLKKEDVYKGSPYGHILLTLNLLITTG